MRLDLPTIIRGTFAFPWRHRALFLSAVGLPLAVLAAALVLMLLLQRFMVGAGEIVGALVLLLVVCWVAVRCHRAVLLAGRGLPEGSTPVGTYLRYDSWLVAGGIVWNVVTLVLAMAATSIVLGFEARANIAAGTVGDAAPAANPHTQSLIDYLALAATVPPMYLLARLSPLLPASAIGRVWTPGTAWKLSRGNGWRLVIIVFLLPQAVSWLVARLWQLDSHVLSTALVYTLFVILTPLEVIALSLSFRELESNLTPRPPDAPAP